MNIGILHPGDMGITLSIPLQQSGHKVVWPSFGRSQQTKDRASQYGLEDVTYIENVLDKCPIIFVLCKNGGPLEIAEAVCKYGYQGVVCDADNLWGEKSELELADKYFSHGIKYVDASLWGWPHNVGENYSQDRVMYLYGKYAESVKSLFTNDYWNIQILTSSAKAHKRYLTKKAQGRVDG